MDHEVERAKLREIEDAAEALTAAWTGANEDRLRARDRLLYAIDALLTPRSMVRESLEAADALADAVEVQVNALERFFTPPQIDLRALHKTIHETQIAIYAQLRAYRAARGQR